MRCSLTTRQREFFEVLERLIEERSEAPSVRELQRALGAKSPGDVVRLLASLKQRGWITYVPHKARSVAIVPDAPPGYVLPAVTEGKLRRYAADHGDTTANAVADIVSLFFDQIEGEVAA
jgi:SOS-response transcriptional repressor LexA